MNVHYIYLILNQEVEILNNKERNKSLLHKYRSVFAMALYRNNGIQ